MKKPNKKVNQVTKTTLELELEVKMQEWVMWIKQEITLILPIHAAQP